MQNTQTQAIVQQFAEQLAQFNETVIDALDKNEPDPDPLISYQNKGLVFPGSVILLQGQKGVFKSSLAESYASLLLGQRGANFFGFSVSDTIVVYIDSERSHSEMVKARRRILTRAKITGNGKGRLFVTSISAASRPYRLSVMEDYMKRHIDGYSQPVFLILDVETDFVTDFNSETETQRFFDSLAFLGHHFGITVLLVCHENPGTTKARGHLGTESANKSSNVLRISRSGTGIVRLDFLHTRHVQEPEPLYLQFVEGVGLVTASEDSANKRDSRFSVEDTLAQLIDILRDGPKPKSEVMPLLLEEIGMSERTLNTHLKEIKKQTIPDEDGQVWKIVSTGNPAQLRLIAVTA
jgi:hypothetical protein